MSNLDEDSVFSMDFEVDCVDDSNYSPIHHISPNPEQTVNNRGNCSPFSCPICKQTFTRNGDMLRHYRKHTGEKPFKCTECGDEFRRKDDMTRHVKTHNGIKPHECPVCQKKFSRKYDMVKHLLVHAGVKARGCPTCGCPFSHRTVGKGHHDDHFTPIVNNHGCPECELSFKRKMDLNKHIKETHPEFLTVASIVKLKTIESDNRYDNTESSSSASNDNNNTEKLDHKPKTTFKTSQKSQNIDDKKTRQEDTRPFECPECSDRFGRKGDMQRHLKIHMGVKPFHCPYCVKKFGRKEDMYRHTKTHNKNNKFTCTLCDVGFGRRTDYALHMLDHKEK